MKRSDVELLAPVGSFESLQAAIQGHADAIYFGVGNLNMRAKSAQNFCNSDMAEIVRRCRESNLRSYLTLNTVMYDQNMEEMHETVDCAVQAGVDAIIASDLAVLGYCKKTGMPVHISTQQNISNVEALEFFAPWADVMVLARELTMDQMTSMAQAIRDRKITGPSGLPLRLEVFAHGALCLAISGKCYLSLHEYNFSANRGSCVQICRRSYEVREKESGELLEIDNEYIMSPKDLCTIEFLDKLLATGVGVLKIEGRARSPEYVLTVCRAYDEALRALESNTYTPEFAAALKEKLLAVFNRGFWDGYYMGKKLGEWSNVYGNESELSKKYIGRVTNYFAKNQVAEFFIEVDKLCVGDAILIIGPTTGVVEMTVTELKHNKGDPLEACRGETITFPVPQFLRRSDKLFILEKRKTKACR